MKKIFALLILALLFTYCKQKPVCNLDTILLKSNDSILSKAKKDGVLKQFLNRMKEPELETFKQETYRFLMMGSFGDYETYRINKYGDNYVITFKSYRKYFEDPITHKEILIDSLSNEHTKSINENDWFEIKNSLSKLNFWELPVRINEHNLDGTAYIIEAYSLKKNNCTNRNYHATSRTSTSDLTLYKLLFEKIIKLTNK